jgi:glycosyltransferase involved in cell wall biosynthesis
MEKTISVVITCFNYGRFLSDCIESVMRQSHKVDEIIVVDDESTDNTAEVCAKYPVTYIWQKNKGLAGARNTGIKAAKGKYIMCLDADDLLTKDSIKEHLALVDEKTIGQCGLTWFGNELGTFRPQGATLQSLLETNTVYCNAVFPRQAWVDTGGYDESDVMRLGLEDWLFWIECAGKGYCFKTSDYIGLLYRKHGSNMTKATTHPNWKKITGYMLEKTKNLR